MVSFYRKDRKDLLFTSLCTWFVLSGIYSIYSLTSQGALFFKLTYLLIIFAALWQWISRWPIRINKGILLGIILTGMGLLVSSWASQFPVRAACTFDLIFASLGIAYLIQTCLAKNLKFGLRCLGLTFFSFTHFALALYAACDYSGCRDYPWGRLIHYNLFNPIAVWHAILYPHGTMEQPFVYTNFAALFAAMLCPFFVGLFFWEKSKTWKIVWGLALAWAVGLLKLGNSRSGYLCVLIVASLCFVYFLWNQCRGRIKQKNIFITVITIACLFCAILCNSEVREALAFIFQGKIKTLLGIRYYSGLDGLSLVKEHPWFGYGCDTSPLYYLKSMPNYSLCSWCFHINPVQVLFEFGSVTTLGLIILVIGYLCFAWKLLHTTLLNSNEKYLVQGALGSFIVYITFFTDCTWGEFVLLSTFFILSGILFALKEKGKKDKRDINNNMKSYSSLLSSLILMLLGTIIYADIKELRGRYAFDHFLHATRYEPQNMIKELEKAIQIYPSNIYFYNQGANVITNKGHPQNRYLMRLAIHYFEESLKLDPWQTYPHKNLGTLYERCGDHLESAKHYITDIEFLPNDSLSYIQLIGLLMSECPKRNDLIEQWLGLAVFNQSQLLAFGPFNRWYLNSINAQRWTWAYFNRYPNVSEQRAALACLLPNQFQCVEQKEKLPSAFNNIFANLSRHYPKYRFHIQDLTLGFFVYVSEHSSFLDTPYAFSEDCVKLLSTERFALRGSPYDPRLMISTLIPLTMGHHPLIWDWYTRYKNSDPEIHLHGRECVRELKEKTLAALAEVNSKEKDV